jgi:hypothetical protein
LIRVPARRRVGSAVEAVGEGVQAVGQGVPAAGPAPGRHLGGPGANPLVDLVGGDAVEE